jgi:hypothetical protein
MHACTSQGDQSLPCIDCGGVRYLQALAQPQCMRLARPEGSQRPLGAHQAQRARPWPSSAPWRAHTPPPLPDHQCPFGRTTLASLALPGTAAAAHTPPSVMRTACCFSACALRSNAPVSASTLSSPASAPQSLLARQQPFRAWPTKEHNYANVGATSVTSSIREALRHTCDADRAHIDACGRSSAGVGMSGVTPVGLTVRTCEAPTADRVSLMQSAHCACACRRERWGECVRRTVRSRGAFAPDRLVVDWWPIEPVARSLLRCCQQRRAPLSLHDVQSTKGEALWLMSHKASAPIGCANEVRGCTHDRESGQDRSGDISCFHCGDIRERGAEGM